LVVCCGTSHCRRRARHKARYFIPKPGRGARKILVRRCKIGQLERKFVRFGIDHSPVQPGRSDGVDRLYRNLIFRVIELHPIAGIILNCVVVVLRVSALAAEFFAKFCLAKDRQADAGT
jgi:hypothetical protein